MNKQAAYELGVQLALQDAGIAKTSGVGATLGLAGMGGGVGAMSSLGNPDADVGRNALIGALMGGGLGAGSSLGARAGAALPVTVAGGGGTAIGNALTQGHTRGVRALIGALMGGGAGMAGAGIGGEHLLGDE